VRREGETDPFLTLHRQGKALLEGSTVSVRCETQPETPDSPWHRKEIVVTRGYVLDLNEGEHLISNKKTSGRGLRVMQARNS
jgi:hypothetical protein